MATETRVGNTIAGLGVPQAHGFECGGIVMTSIIKNRAREYRDRAEEARQRAADAVGHSARSSLLQIADTWERMAAYEDRTIQRRPVSPPPASVGERN